MNRDIHIHAELAHDLDELVTAKDIIRFESGMNIPVVRKLQPNLSELRSEAKFHLPKLKNRTISYSGTPSVMIRYIDSWLKSENCVQPTWRNFLTILREISPDLCVVADQIKATFDSTSVSKPTTDTQDREIQSKFQAYMSAV